MFYHVVLMRLERVDAAFHARVEQYAGVIRRDLSGIVSYRYGRNLAGRGKGYDWAVIGVFASAADHDAYQLSRAHQELKAYMTPHIADMVVCDVDAPRPA